MVERWLEAFAAATEHWRYRQLTYGSTADKLVLRSFDDLTEIILGLPDKE